MISNYTSALLVKILHLFINAWVSFPSSSQYWSLKTLPRLCYFKVELTSISFCFLFKKAEDIEEPECFYILFERGSKGLGAPPGHLNVGKPAEDFQHLHKFSLNLSKVLHKLTRLQHSHKAG